MDNLENSDPEDAKMQMQHILTRFDSAQKQRSNWERIWQECYDHALPQRGGFTIKPQSGGRRTDHIYDATAMDAVDQLASSMLGNLTPTWSQWFGLKPGPDLSDSEAEQLAPILEKAAKTIQDHGYLDGAFRQLGLTQEQIQSRYPLADIPAKIQSRAAKNPQERFKVLEAIVPEGLIYSYHACLMEDENQPEILATGRFEQSPVISFRWLKSPGEVYGRSPVMKALPDIKTANKVVELILKNASIAVTGIWQADDDGVLNPANIELSPGSIIPKAIGSKGLQPLEMPGRFDVSQLVLDSLQSRIRHALFADRLAPVNGPKMTATEVLERSAEMALLLGATYGRLQSELLTPLIKRAFSILKRRGEIPDIELDGRLVAVDYRSPLARSQGQRNVQNTLSWISSVIAMGPEASASINFPQAARFLGDALGVPSDLIRKEVPLSGLENIIQAAPDIAQSVTESIPTPELAPEPEGEIA